MADPKATNTQEEQIRIGKLNRLNDLLEKLPKLESMEQKAVQKEEELNEAKALCNEAFEKTEGLKKVYEEQLLAVKQSQEELELARKHNAEWSAALKQQTLIDDPKRPWNLKRVAWAIVSAAAGVGLALFLRKKAPMMNTAAGGCMVGSLMGKSKVTRNHALIGSAGGSLATRWAQSEDNLVGLTAETILAGGAYAELTFNVGEAVVDGAGEAVASVKEGYQKTKEKLTKEVPIE